MWNPRVTQFHVFPAIILHNLRAAVTLPTVDSTYLCNRNFLSSFSSKYFTSVFYSNEDKIGSCVQTIGISNNTQDRINQNVRGAAHLNISSSEYRGSEVWFKQRWFVYECARARNIAFKLRGWYRRTNSQYTKTAC